MKCDICKEEIGKHQKIHRLKDSLFYKDYMFDAEVCSDCHAKHKDDGPVIIWEGNLPEDPKRRPQAVFYDEQPAPPKEEA